MSEQKIRVGIIGANVSYGWGLRAHLPAILALPEFELAAVCTSRPETAAASQEQFGARLAFGEMADALLLASTRVHPARLREGGFRFGFPGLEEALRHVLGRAAP